MSRMTTLPLPVAGRSTTVYRRTRRSIVLAGGPALAALTAACNLMSSKPAADPARGSLAPATLEVWYQFRTPETDRVVDDKVVPAFTNRYPTVKIQPVPGAGFGRLPAMAAAGTPPHLLQMGAAQVIAAVQAGLALSLTDYTKKWTPMDDFVPAALDQARWRGQQWGLPYDAQPNTYFWRQDLLDQRGVRRIPETYEASLDVARQLTEIKTAESGTLEVARVGLGSVQPWAEFFMGMRSLDLPLVRQGKAVFNSAEGLMLLQYQVDRRTATTRPGSAAPAIIANPLGGQNPVGLGTWAGGWGSYLTLANAARVGTPETYRHIVASTPLVPGNQQYVVPGRRAAKPATFSFHNWWMIVKPATAHEQAWAFLQHLMSPEMLMAFDETLGTTAPRKSLIGQGFMAEEKMRRVNELYRQHGAPQYKYPEAPRLNPAIIQPIDKAIAGQMSPKAALDEAAQAWNTIMAEVSYTEDVS